MQSIIYDIDKARIMSESGHDLVYGIILTRGDVTQIRVATRPAVANVALELTAKPDYTGIPLITAGGTTNAAGTIGAEVTTTNVRRKNFYVDSTYREEWPDDIPPDEEDPEQPPPPGPDSVTTASATNYKGTVDSYYADTRLVPASGQISLGRIRPDSPAGKIVSIINDRPEWVDMGAMVQQILIDPMSGSTALQVGSPDHISLQDMINSSKALDNLKQDSEMATEKKDDESDSFTWENDAEYEMEPRKKRPEAPGVGPSVKLITNTYKPYLDAEFAVRPLTSFDGLNKGYQVHQGRIIQIQRSQTLMAGGQVWTTVLSGDGSIYCNYSTDKYGALLTATFAQSPGPIRPHIVPDGDTFDPSTLIPGTYSIKIADITGGKINQIQLGPIPLAYEKGSVVP